MNVLRVKAATRPYCIVTTLQSLDWRLNVSASMSNTCAHRTLPILRSLENQAWQWFSVWQGRDLLCRWSKQCVHGVGPLYAVDYVEEELH